MYTGYLSLQPTEVGGTKLDYIAVPCKLKEHNTETRTLAAAQDRDNRREQQPPKCISAICGRIQWKCDVFIREMPAEVRERETHEPEAHEPEAHEPEAHEPEAHKPEVSEQELIQFD